MNVKKPIPVSQAIKALGLAVITIAVAILIPVSAPLIGILYIVIGWIFRVRTVDPNERVFWWIVLGVGVLLILGTALILLTQIRVR